MKKMEIEDNSLTAETVALDFCKATYHLIKGRRITKIRKGSFRPTFNIDKDNNTHNKLQPDKKHMQKPRVPKYTTSKMDKAKNPMTTG
jgi:hypothetical protein